MNKICPLKDIWQLKGRYTLEKMNSGYVTTYIEGLKPELDESRIITFHIEDRVAGSLRITLYITAGKHSPKIISTDIETIEGTDGSKIIGTNKRIFQNSDSFPVKLWGTDKNSVCFQSVAAYLVKEGGEKELNCEPGTQYPFPTVEQLSKPNFIPTQENFDNAVKDFVDVHTSWARMKEVDLTNWNGGFFNFFFNSRIGIIQYMIQPIGNLSPYVKEIYQDMESYKILNFKVNLMASELAMETINTLYDGEVAEINEYQAKIILYMISKIYILITNEGQLIISPEQDTKIRIPSGPFSYDSIVKLLGIEPKLGNMVDPTRQ